MNFSIVKHNDTLVLALLYLDTPLYKGLAVYPVPMMEDEETIELRDRILVNHPVVESNIQRIRPAFHVLLNLTDYSNDVLKFFFNRALNEKQVAFLTCEETIQEYLGHSWNPSDYTFIYPTEAVKDIFETINPLNVAKYITFK